MVKAVTAKNTNLKVQLQIKEDLVTALKLKLDDSSNTSVKTTELHNKEGIHNEGTLPQGEWKLQFLQLYHLKSSVDGRAHT